MSTDGEGRDRHTYWLVDGRISYLLPVTLSNPSVLVRQINSIWNNSLRRTRKVPIVSNLSENGSLSRPIILSIKPGVAAFVVLDHCDCLANLWSVQTYMLINIWQWKHKFPGLWMVYPPINTSLGHQSGKIDRTFIRSAHHGKCQHFFLETIYIAKILQ